MVDRITITKPTYMKIDGQWRIVLSGTTCDVPSAMAYSGSSTMVGTPGSGGTLASHGGPTPVGTIRAV